MIPLFIIDKTEMTEVFFRRIVKLWYFDMMGDNSVIKKDKQLLHATLQIDHTSVVLKKINQTQKSICCMIPFDKIQKLTKLVKIEIRTEVA